MTITKKPARPARKPSRNFGHKIEHAPKRQPLPKTNLKLITSYALVTYVFVSLVIITFSYCTYSSYMERKLLQMDAAAYEIELNFSGTLSYAESVLNHINRQISTSKVSNDQIAEILSSFNRSHYGYNSIKDMLSAGMFYWVDANQQLVASSAGPITSPIDLSSRDYLNKTMQDPWRIYSGAPIVGAASGQYVMPAGVGVVDSKGNYVGTSVVSFKIYNLIERFKRLTDYYKTDFAILDENNKVLLESNTGLFSKNTELLNDLKICDESLHREFVSSYSPLSKGHYVIVRNLEKYPYKVVIGNKQSEMTSEMVLEMMPHMIEFLAITIFFIIMLTLLRGSRK